MANGDHKKSNDWYFPPDVAAALGPIICIIIVVSVSSGVSWAKSFGDTKLFRFALLIGGIGVVLLFFARLPLYRKHRFFTCGPRSVTGTHRKLYYAAYVFIIPSIVLLGILALTVK
jgi:hypothetical protein